MKLLPLAASSLWSRRNSAALVMLSIALSVLLLLGVERLREQARTSFAQTVAGVDLVVGARTGPINLLLYTVFRLGEPTANVSWESYQQIAEHPQVAWTVPLSLGDSYRGYPVLATNENYFRYLKYGKNLSLTLARGDWFAETHDAVLGAEVARVLEHDMGDEIIISHGLGAVSLTHHDDQPFRVTGVLAPTGTPVDHTIHISLTGFEAMHAGWRGGAPVPGFRARMLGSRLHNLTPSSITGFLVGLESRGAVFALQREINNWQEEPLLAIIPGLTLQQLWDLMAVAEQVLLAVSWLVLLVALTAMMTALLTGLNERRREMAILRSLGAHPRQIFTLILGECLLLTLCGIVLGIILMQWVSWLLSSWVSGFLGMGVSIWLPTSNELHLLLLVVIGGLLAGLWPAWQASRQVLADGMIPRY